MRYDSSKGFVLINKNGKELVASEDHEFRTEGNIKDLNLIKHQGKEYILAVPNNGKVQSFLIK